MRPTRPTNPDNRRPRKTGDFSARHHNVVTHQSRRRGLLCGLAKEDAWHRGSGSEVIEFELSKSTPASAGNGLIRSRSDSKTEVRAKSVWPELGIGNGPPVSMPRTYSQFVAQVNMRSGKSQEFPADRNTSSRVRTSARKSPSRYRVKSADRGKTGASPKALNVSMDL